MLWRNSWSITGQTHKKLTSICWVQIKLRYLPSVLLTVFIFHKICNCKWQLNYAKLVSYQAGISLIRAWHWQIDGILIRKVFLLKRFSTQVNIQNFSFWTAEEDRRYGWSSRLCTQRKQLWKKSWSLNFFQALIHDCLKCLWNEIFAPFFIPENWSLCCTDS